MSDDDPGVRRLAASALESRDSPEVNAQLIAMLAHHDPEVRLLALKSLARRRAQEALPAIKTLVDDPDARVGSLARSVSTSLLPNRYEQAGYGPAELTAEEAAPAKKAPAKKGTQEKVGKLSEPRRLVARVYDYRDNLVESVLPPQRALKLAIRVAIPEPPDIACDEILTVPAVSGPTVALEVDVRGQVLDDNQPTTQEILLPMQKVSDPSGWAVFTFTTPDAGKSVSIEIQVFTRASRLQAATYVSPVRAVAIPGERPTLRAFALSGPHEPTDDSRPVAVDTRWHGR